MELKQLLDSTLKKEPNFLTDKGEIKKWVVINKAQNFDETLIGLLLSEPQLKAEFFKEIKDIWVFNLNIFTDFIEQKEFLEDSYTRFANKIGITIGGKFLRQRNEVSLVWPYKDCILEGGQSREEDSRKEIFFNELLAHDEITQLLEPKVVTNVKFFGDTQELIPTSNLLIKGNNLLALYSLKKKFTGKVKLIYIDPPYNTKSDSFHYNDSFNHSSWLTFMKNRLEISRKLLKEDGVIFIQCDDNEQAYLKVLCDEIYGDENFMNSICIKMSHLSGVKMSHKDKKIPKLKEFILIYAKNKQNVRINPIYVEGKWNNVLDRYNYFVDKSDTDCSKWKICNLNAYMAEMKPKTSIEIDEIKIKNADNIFRTARNDSFKNIPVNNFFEKIITKTGLEKYVFKGEEVLFASTKIKNIDGRDVPADVIGDIWTDIGINNLHKEGEISFENGKKPLRLLKRIINIIVDSNTDSIILDFFAGSGTTAQAVLELNKEDGGKRQFIICEQMDYAETITTERIKKVIEKNDAGSFVYLELKKHNENFVEKIRDAENSEALLKIWEDMKEKSFLNYNVDIKKQDANIEDFKTFTLEIQKQHLVTLLDKNQLYVSMSNMNDTDCGVTEEERTLTKTFYQND